MFKLLRMEFLVNRRQLFIILAIFTLYFAFLVYRFPSPRFFLIITSLMIGLAMPFAILGREDKFKTGALICSLPVRRSTIALAKYVATWIVIFAGLAYAYFLGAVLPFSNVNVFEVMNLKSVLIALALASLLITFVLPFTIRFGLTGIIIFLIGTQLLGVIMLLLTQILGRQHNPLRFVLGALEKGIRAVFYHPPTLLFFLALLGAILALNAISFLIARPLYIRKEM